MSPSFTGERLHSGQELFAVDLARHRAAYRFALERVGRGRVLDLGSGSGYGTRELASRGATVVGLDRAWPDSPHRRGARFVRGALESVPLRPRSFDWVVSFQVIEHLSDPGGHLRGLARLVKNDGSALVTTPNRLTSEGVNPFHVREYTGQELAPMAAEHFYDVEMLGVSKSPGLTGYFDARSRRIATLMRLDPLGLRRRLPRPLVEYLFGRLAIVVRWSVRRQGELPAVSWRDFPIGPLEESCLDLVALCHRPRL